MKFTQFTQSLIVVLALFLLGINTAWSLDRSHTFLQIHQKSTCGQPVEVTCPDGYIRLGGGIYLNKEKCRDSVSFPNDDFPEAFINGFASFPTEGNGWRCRGDRREVDCFAICGHKEATGIYETVLASDYMTGHKDFDRDRGNHDGEREADARCPSGTTVIGGGLESESMWELPYYKDKGLRLSDREEYKVFGMFKEGNGWHCSEESNDHWSTCYAICVPNDQLQKTSVRIQPLHRKVRSCQAGETVIGGGFFHCPARNCNQRIDSIEAWPQQPGNQFWVKTSTTSYRSHVVESQSVCAETN